MFKSSVMKPDAAPLSCDVDWLLRWQGGASAREAARVLARVGFVAVVAGRDAPDLPAPLQDELAQAAGSADARGFLIRRGVARAVAAAILGLEAGTLRVVHTPQGAPRFAGGPLHLSFSARGEQAVIALGNLALGNMALGVDLERGLPPAGIPWNMLRADECEALRALPAAEQDEAFLALWRAKEAVVKALGRGFVLAPEAVRITGGQAMVEGFGPRFTLHQAPKAGVCLALSDMPA